MDLFSEPKLLNHTVCVLFWLWNCRCKVSSPTLSNSHSALVFWLWKRCQEESSSFKDRVGGLSYSSLSLLGALCIPDASSAVLVPSRSSWPKLVPCWDRVPPRSTTASSSFLCWQTQTKTYYIIRNIIQKLCHAISCLSMKQHNFQCTSLFWT